MARRKTRKPRAPSTAAQLAEAKERIAGLESEVFNIKYPTTAFNPVDYPPVKEVNLDCGPKENPKGIAGAKKVPLHLFPTIGTILGAMACEDGAKKYGVNNWRGTPIKLTDYISAISRHLLAIQDGEDVDPKSGVKHLGHIMASAAIVADAEECGMLIDDRTFPIGVAGRALDKYQKRD